MRGVCTCHQWHHWAYRVNGKISVVAGNLIHLQNLFNWHVLSFISQSENKLKHNQNSHSEIARYDQTTDTTWMPSRNVNVQKCKSLRAPGRQYKQIYKAFLCNPKFIKDTTLTKIFPLSLYIYWLLPTNSIFLSHQTSHQPISSNFLS